MKTILVTGASQGIGKAIAEKCLKEGCRVILLANDEVGLKRTKSEFVAAGFDAAKIEIQNVDLEQVREIPKKVAQFPWIKEGLDGLVNNAGIEILGKTQHFSIDDMEKMFRVNSMAPVVMIQSCWDSLVKAKGSVVNIGSIADQRYHELYAIYGGCKSFLRTFTKHVAQEIGFQGVRINSVSPGGVQTPMMDIIAEKHFKAEDIAVTLKQVPIEQRWGKSEEIADAVWFGLTGPRYFHGDDIRIHGGIAS